MLSYSYLEKLSTTNPMNSIFYICFYMCFNLVLLLFFIAIILSNYNKMKIKINQTATALSRIAAHDSEKISQKWMNLICMKPPIDEEVEIKPGQEPPSLSEKCIIFDICIYFGYFRHERKKSKGEIYGRRNYLLQFEQTQHKCIFYFILMINLS